MERRLIIFTRFPEPGRTKTRLIPALGPGGAAALQRDMTRHIIDVARKFQARCNSMIEIRFEGGDTQQMEARFGRGLFYRAQGSGNLGCRMHRACAEATAEGADQVIIIGADCPEITAELLEYAFERLLANDLEIGPTHDGGYYLIGLRRSVPQLFDNIPWGSDRVFEQTVHRAHRLSLTVDRLGMLSDVDCPEDLVVWQRAKRLSASTTAEQPISIVIPTLNEAGNLPQTLASIRNTRETEVIVVDGGSHDGTVEIAEQENCRVLHSPPGRALQLNTGAQSATGELLLFLHADTRLPAGFDSAVRSTINEPKVVGGAFRLRIDAPGWPMRVIERAVAIRSRILQMPYGDQSLFIRNGLFHELGGFSLLPIMDDYEFTRQLRRKGTIKIVDLPATTSGRRWKKLGPWRTTWVNQKMVLGYHLGVAPERLATWYGTVVE